jgi:6-phosphogluconolactonase (cycloisomerase 2 family)
MVKVSPDGSHIGVALSGGGDLIYPFTQSSGSLGKTAQQILTPATGYEDNALAFDPTGNYLYIARYGSTAGSGSVVSYNAAGASNLGSVVCGDNPKSVLVNSADSAVYVAYTSSNGSGISGYSVASGVLTQLTGSPFAASAGVDSLVLDKTGDYIIAAANDSSGNSDLTLYAFDAITPTTLDAVQQTKNGSGTAGSLAVVATH